MPTDTFTIAGNSDDGNGRFNNFGTTGWTEVGNGTFLDQPYGANTCATQVSGLGGGSYMVACSYFRWDTSSIPDDATITSARLIVYVKTYDDPAEVTFGFDFYDFGGTASVAGDWQRFSSCDAIAAFDLDTLTANAVNNLTLTGLTGINKSGYTGLRSGKANDTDPGDGAGDNYFDIAAFDDPALDPPKLEVTYTTGAGTGQVVTPFTFGRVSQGKVSAKARVDSPFTFGVIVGTHATGDDLLHVSDAAAVTQIQRSVNVGDGVQAQLVAADETTEIVPDLTGATTQLQAVTSGAAVPLDPPNAGARTCFMRVWEDSQSVTARLFFRRDGTAPTNAGANCEGWLRHGEGKMIRLAAPADNFLMIAESGSAWHITCEYSNT